MKKHVLIVNNVIRQRDHFRGFADDNQPMVEKPTVNETAMLPIITPGMSVNSKRKARDCDCPECRKKPEQTMFYTTQNGERS